MRRSTLTGLAAMSMLLLMIGGAGPAHADVSLIRGDPAAGEEVSVLQQVTLSFSGELQEPAFVSVRPRGGDQGAGVRVGAPVIRANEVSAPSRPIFRRVAMSSPIGWSPRTATRSPASTT